ncbi:hypothetical protein THTE_4333 [Thermogutta terrifontis]|uniref:Uncharacterized protein n=1 Tax=Thermogutta terrifontis TaxID=1331910 RepID=A0A286RLU4_9BACT|nr:hypothetical protein [Thermogutta terrifontis]ASV76934.1 hypothetical protein THTE_4333 [Thermogutta terrifontis]
MNACIRSWKWHILFSAGCLALALFYPSELPAREAGVSNPQPSPAVVANLAPFPGQVTVQDATGEGVLTAIFPPRTMATLVLRETCRISATGQLPPTATSSRCEEVIGPGSLGILYVVGQPEKPTFQMAVVTPQSDPSALARVLTTASSALDQQAMTQFITGGYTSLGVVWEPNLRPRKLLVPVKILVDDEEPAARRIWEARLRARIAAVNDILGRFCPIQLNVVAAETWRSNDKLASLEDGYQQFVTTVDPLPGTLAIGFASQWASQKQAATLGTCAGPFSRHILLREHGPAITETERVEMLLHELGHVFGAVHIADTDSLMRPKLENRRARDRQFLLGFDPVNTLVMNMVAGELLQRKTRWEDFSEHTRGSLLFCYRALVAAEESDETASLLIERLEQVSRQQAPLVAGVEPGQATDDTPSGDLRESSDQPPTRSPAVDLAHGAPAPEPPGETRSSIKPATPEATAGLERPTTPQEHQSGREAREKTGTASTPPTGSTDVFPPPAPPEESLAAARWVIQAVVAEWDPAAVPVSGPRPMGDAVMEMLVRKAAEVAQQIPAQSATQRSAFLRALAVLVDDSIFLREQPGLGVVWAKLETEAERQRRLARIPLPTIEGRHDWAQHFGVSAALTDLLGAGPARSLGLAKEWRDAQGDSGFSFTDLAADYAGVVFAEAVQSGRISLAELAENFTLPAYVPPLSRYPEEISFPRMIREYGGFFGERTRAIVREIEDAIGSLPAYRRSP